MATIDGTKTRATHFGFDDHVSDSLHGTNGEDVIRGWGGSDHLFGNGGHDEINGGFGDDFITGGTGWDTLTGGKGADTFIYAKGDSGSHFDTSDIITDFNAAEGDRIHLGNFTPSAGQYLETTVFDDGNHVDNFNLARSYAAHHIGLDGVRVVFASDHHDGYLFADIDGNGVIDTGIELHGLNDLGDFSKNQLF